MTCNDFMALLIESSLHYRSEIFFEDEKDKVPSRYRVAFDNGLLDFFKWYNYVVNSIDNYRFLLTKPDGTTETGVMSFSPDIYNVQKKNLLQTGVLSFPFKTTIPVINESSGEIVMELDDAFLASIWPHLSAHLHIANGSDDPPPVQAPGPGDMKLNDKILMPHSIARQLTNSMHFTDSNSVNQEMVMTQQTEKLRNASEIRTSIKDKVWAIDGNLHWKYVFADELEYNIFLDLFSNFLAGLPYKLPNEIKLKIGCKTRFAPLLGMIYKRDGKSKIKKDVKYLQLLKILSCFSGVEASHIYKDITREKDIS